MMLAASIAIAAPLILAGEKDFFHIPGEEEFRLQHISRAKGEFQWPFTVDEGFLSCAYVMGLRTVYFTEGPTFDDGNRAPRTVVVSTDPLDLGIGNLGDGGLVVKAETIPDLIRMMAPLQAIGTRLCDQPAGTQIGPGEL